jgi:hypothetical protein
MSRSSVTRAKSRLRRRISSACASTSWITFVGRENSFCHVLIDLVLTSQPLGHLADRTTPILDLSDRVALELVCKLGAGHIGLLASKITKQGVYKSRGYSR